MWDSSLYFWELIVKVSCHVCHSDRIVQFREENKYQILSCLDCHLLFVENDKNMLDIENDKKNKGVNAEFLDAELKKDYWVDANRQSLENNSLYLATHKYFIDRVLGLFPEKNSINLIDVGCGFGFFVLHASRAGIDAVGIDTSENAINFGRTQLGLNNLFCSSLANYASTKKTYKVVTAFNLLEHVNVGIVKDMYRLVEPGGYVLIRIPNAAFHRAFHWALCLFGLERKVSHSVLAWGPPHHLYGFSKKNLNILLSNEGFTQIEICQSPLSDTSNLLNYRILVSLMSRFVYLMSGKKFAISPTIYVLAKKPATF